MTCFIRDLNQPAAQTPEAPTIVNPVAFLKLPRAGSFASVKLYSRNSHIFLPDINLSREEVLARLDRIKFRL